MSGSAVLVDHTLLRKLYTVDSRYLKVDGTIFCKFKLPKVQINMHFGLFGLTPNYGRRHFEFRRIRDIRVRDIESRLYLDHDIISVFRSKLRNQNEKLLSI